MFILCSAGHRICITSGLSYNCCIIRNPLRENCIIRMSSCVHIYISDGELKFNICIFHRRRLWSCDLQTAHIHDTSCIFTQSGKGPCVHNSRVTMLEPVPLGREGGRERRAGGLCSSSPVAALAQWRRTSTLSPHWRHAREGSPALPASRAPSFPGRVANRIAQGLTCTSRCLQGHCTESSWASPPHFQDDPCARRASY